MSACCYDTNPPDVCAETWRRARKEHQCCECGAPILPGQTYQHLRILWEGAWSTAKTCGPCADLREAIMESACPELGGLKNAYMEYLDAGKPRVYPDNHMKLNER